MHTLKEFLDTMAQRYGRADAYVWMDGERMVSRSFEDLRRDACVAAGFLTARFGTGKHIALLGDMSYDWIVTWYGIILAGHVSVPLDSKLTPAEIRERLAFADVSAVFLSRQHAFLKEDLAGSGDWEVLRLGDASGKTAVHPEISLPSADPDALCSLMFTSGTSGDGLKAAMITQRGILADVTGPVPLCVPGDRLLSVLPIHHCFEIFVGQMKYLYLGAAIFINDSMANLIPNLTRFGITIVVAVPALANMLAAFIARGLQTHTMEEVKQMLGGKLRRITIGGASASREVIDTLGRAGITIFVGYGLTESTGGCLANCDASLRPLEAGAPYVEGMEMKLEDGELCLRGPMIMQGYYKAPELTAKVMENGWFHTGDLAEITEENYVIIKGRKDNMIKTPSGEKIYPENWESRLSMIAGVSAAMVASVDQHLTAILTLREDTPEKREAAVRAIDTINATLPGYEKILDVRFREKPFPMTTSMKIRRREVMQEMETRKNRVMPPENDRQREILRHVMEVLSADTPIGIDENLYERGLDSLGTITLALLLDCPPEAVYACKTIRSLSEHVLTSCSGVGKTDRDINRFIPLNPPSPEGLPDPVLLTGASGYLGAHLLAELVRHGKRVICLVRSRERLEETLRYDGFSDLLGQVETVVGDICQSQFGLRDAVYRDLCTRVHSVLHAAARVSHVGSLEESFRVNVGGTQEILRFCEAGGAVLFHISTYAVAGFGTDVPLTEHVLDIGQDITRNPYVQTKYLAEEQVLKARGNGVPSAVFRVGNLTARSSDGLFQKNADENGMAAQLRAFRKLGCYPACMEGVLYDQTPVDRAAEAIIQLAENHGAGNIWHIMSPDRKSIHELSGANRVSDGAFDEILSHAPEDRDAAILSVYLRMARETFNLHFHSEYTEAALKRLGFVWQ